MLTTFRLWIVALLLLSVASSAHAATHPLSSADLVEAHELEKDHKYAAAAKIYARWLKEHPEDANVLMSSGYNFYLQARAESDRVQSAVLTKKAYAQLDRAKKLGCEDPLLDMLLGTFDAKGQPLTSEFSANEEAQTLLHRGEQAFAKGRLSEALVLYQQALEHDPKNFAATLFIGDIHFNRGEYDDAIAWFNKAALLQPNTETAHRYCGDAHLKMGRTEDALGKYIDAFIAEPYKRIPSETLKHWSARNRTQFTRPKIAIPVVPVEIKEGKLNIGYDPDNGPLVLLYALARGKWLTEDRAAFFANDATPRHSLPEEKSGLEAVIAFADGSAPEMKAEISRWKNDVATLRRLQGAGFLDAFILLDRADSGIAQDYAAYRETDRATLVRYIREIWLGQKPAD